MLDQTPSDYQNMSAITEISVLTKQNESKASNDYCQTHATEGGKEEITDSEAVAAEEKLLKPSDTQWCMLTKVFKPFSLYFKTGHLELLSY